MFELFRHPWFKNWGDVIDTDVSKVLASLKKLQGSHVDTLRRLLENTFGSKACGSVRS